MYKLLALAGLFSVFQAMAQRPKRTILFFIDGLHWQAPDKIQMPVFNRLKSEGVYVKKSVMIAPHHPTVGDYAKENTSSFPNPILHQGSIFIHKENKMLQELFSSKEKTAFYVNTVAYNSVNRGFHFSIAHPNLTDSQIVTKALHLIEEEDPTFFRIHLQTPGNEGRYLSYTTPDKPFYRNIWGKNSPYVHCIEQADKLLGQLVESLKKSGKWEETLLIVSSDQGQSRIGWHPVADEESWLTPMLITGPGLPKGKTVSYAEHTDLAHTIAFAMGKKMPINGGSGKVDSNLISGTEDRSVNRFPLLHSINMQCAEYAMLRAKIQLNVEKDLYNSSYLTFLENELLTPEPFYHLDRFTEWSKAKSTENLYEANARILSEMKTHLNLPGNDAWYFDKQVIANYADRSIDYYFNHIYPNVKFQPGHYLAEVYNDEKNFRWPTHNDWNQSTFFVGLSAWWKFSGKEEYYKRILEWAQKDDFTPLIWDKDLGNNHLAGDVYLDLFDHSKIERCKTGIQKDIDRFLTLPYQGQNRWWWCDALFMAPPTFLHLSKATGNDQYRRFAHEKWDELTRELQDKKEGLFYRDAKYIFNKTDKSTWSENGKKIFWGRGNGWVVAGTVRMLEQMQGNDPERSRYETQLKSMCHSLKNLQEADGCWTVSLFDKQAFPKGETSSTAFITYAMAYGIRKGLIPKEIYLPVVQKAWKGIIGRTSKDGKPGFVQAVGHDPREINSEHTDAFGIGAFLLAALEMYQLQP